MWSHIGTEVEEHLVFDDFGKLLGCFVADDEAAQCGGSTGKILGA